MIVNLGRIGRSNRKTGFDIQLLEEFILWTGLLFVHGIRRSENDYLTEGMNSFDHQDHEQSSRSQRFGGSTLTLIVIVIPMTVVVATPSAKSGIIPCMLAFVHTFTVGAVNFSAVGFSDIFVP